MAIIENQKRVSTIGPDGKNLTGINAKKANVLNLEASLEEGETIRGRTVHTLTRRMRDRREKLLAKLKEQLHLS